MHPRSAAALVAPVVVVATCLAACVSEPAKTRTSPGSPTTVVTVPAGAPAPNPPAGTRLATFTTADFSGPSVCASCHTGMRDESGADVTVPEDWRATMMANAARDPVWQAKVSSEVARNPGLTTVIEEKCTTCHMPMAETQAVALGQPVTALGDGFFDRDHDLHAAAIDGVSCTLCHQVSDTNLGTMEGFSGHYTVDTTTEAPNRIIHGPYEQPFGRPMQNMSGYTPAFGAHMLTAEHCATCHNLYTPYVDATGTVLGEFPEQTPYTEWENSRYATEATSCQECHMPLAAGGVVISNMPRRLAPREPFFQHVLVGGNSLMLGILATWGGDMEAGADAEAFVEKSALTAEQVSGRTAALTLEDLDLTDGTFEADLRVVTLTGHKFPTSFPSRRAWLHVTVTDSAGAVVFESGAPTADGAITGNAADEDPAGFEPHHDVITSPDQVQVWEPIMGNSDGEVTYTLLRAASYLKDNRLLPEGADKPTLPADIAVYGAAAGDADFVGGGDVVTYRVAVGDGVAPFTLSAELLYEPLSYRFVTDLLSDGTDLTERFGGYWDAAERTPLQVAFVEGTA
ncbi:MAG: hypothetical protein ACQERF_01565 [Actinomycetota bacterium]